MMRNAPRCGASRSRRPAAIVAWALLALPIAAAAALPDKTRETGVAPRPRMTAAAAPAQPLSAADLYARLSPSVWVVRTYDQDDLRLGQGSAVVIAPQTLVTNCHVLRKARRVEVTHDKEAHAATLELWSVADDLCQLKAPGVEAPAVALADEATLAVGQPVYALGAPRGLELTLSAGLISSLRLDPSTRGIARIQTSAPISPGSSGGGLFDDGGRLVGITQGAFVDAQNLNLAVPVGMVRDLPQRHAAAQAARSANTPASTVLPPIDPLVGRWAGEMRCGAFLGSVKVEHPEPWSVPLAMSVSQAGSVVLERGDTTYSESLSGVIHGDLSATLRGLGAYKRTPGETWQTEVSGRFSGSGSALQFSGTGDIGTTVGGVGRHCTVNLTKAG